MLQVDIFPFFCILATDILNLAQFKETPLHFAAREGNNSTVMLLLDQGADIHMKGQICASLIFLSININTLNVASDGTETLHFAAESGNLDVVRLLLDKGADVHAKSKIHTYILKIINIHFASNKAIKIHPRICKI